MAPGARGVEAAQRLTPTRAPLVAVMALLVVGTAACTSGSHPQVGGSPTASVAPTITVIRQLAWSTPKRIDVNKNGLGDVSCPTVRFCVAVGSTGPGVVSSAYIWNGTAWSATAPHLFAQDQSGFNHISCPSVSFCMAGAVGALTWNGRSWSARSQIRWPAPNDGITNLACASSHFCLAGDEDGDIRVWHGTSWSIDHQLVPGSKSGGAHAVSCASANFCVAVNLLGNAIVWNGRSLSRPRDIDGHNGLNAVSCPSARFCMALDGGDWIVWNGTSWSAPEQIPNLDTSPDSGLINWVSCPSASFCVAVVSDGKAFVWDGTSWSGPRLIDRNLTNAHGEAATSRNGHPSLGFKSVSCPSPSFCVAVGSDGDVVIGRQAG